ncbi:hypothetical protein BH11PSE13_BH11PSE13_11160 [soil metagenome]
MSPNELIMEFHTALKALLVSLVKVGAVQSDEDAYSDELDTIVEPLWQSMVCSSLGYGAGLDRVLNLPRYGFSRDNGRVEAVMIATGTSAGDGRFVQFIGDRTFGNAQLNAMDIQRADASIVRVAFSDDVRFSLSRSADWLRAVQVAAGS